MRIYLYVSRQSKQVRLKTEPDEKEKSRKADIVQYLLGNLLSQQGKVKEAIASYQTFSYQQILASQPELAKQHWNPQKSRKPDFIICGLPKCGTTSIYGYLTSHPQVITAVKKIKIFSLTFYRNLDYYYAHSHVIHNNYLTSEATPSYFFWANTQQIFK